MRNVILLGLGLLLLASCNSIKRVDLGPSAKSDYFQGMAYCMPIVDYGYIDRRNDVEPSDSISQLVQDAFMYMSSRTRMPEMFGCSAVVPCDPMIGANTLKQIATGTDITKGIKVDEYMLPQDIDSRYVMMFYSSGFTRRFGNYLGQTAKGFGISVLAETLLGADVNVEPIKYTTSLAVVIVDTQTHEVVYSSMISYEIDPLDEFSHEKCFRYILAQYRSAMKYLKKQEAKKK